MSKLLYEGGEWTLDRIDRTWEVIDKIAKEKYGLDYYRPSIEIVTADQMIHYMATIGMPTSYSHWSFGKNAMQTEKQYQKTGGGLPYEMIINTDPARAYIMENNSMTMQALVLAHAVCGHSSFFKTNYYFKQWSDASFIEDFLKFGRDFVKECEDKYGAEAVERTLDACHALQNYGVDKHKRAKRKRPAEAAAQAAKRELHDVMSYDPSVSPLLDATAAKKMSRRQSRFDWPFPEENILYFIEKNSPGLQQWQREIVRIVRKTAQYFYPQAQTKIMNEGWATFWHYTLITDLFEGGYINDGHYLEFLHNHTNVVAQQAHGQFNPYAIGFNMMMDIRRMSENPTEEDKQWFPSVAGGDWLENIKYAATNFRDQEFILQYLSPKVVRDMDMYSVGENEKNKYYEITDVQHTEDVKRIRSALSKQVARSRYTPQIEVVDYIEDKDRALYLRHMVEDGRTLDPKTAKAVMPYVKFLWGKNFPVFLREEEEGEKARIYSRRY